METKAAKNMVNAIFLSLALIIGSSSLAFGKSEQIGADKLDKGNRSGKKAKIQDNEIPVTSGEKNEIIYKVKISEDELSEDERKLIVKEMIVEIESGKGLTLLVIGGDFTSLSKAQFYSDKVKSEYKLHTHVIALYNGKVTSLEKLEKMGMLQ